MNIVQLQVRVVHNHSLSHVSFIHKSWKAADKLQILLYIVLIFMLYILWDNRETLYITLYCEQKTCLSSDRRYSIYGEQNNMLLRTVNIHIDQDENTVFVYSIII